MFGDCPLVFVRSLVGTSRKARYVISRRLFPPPVSISLSQGSVFTEFCTKRSCRRFPSFSVSRKICRTFGGPLSPPRNITSTISLSSALIREHQLRERRRIHRLPLSRPYNAQQQALLVELCSNFSGSDGAQRYYLVTALRNPAVFESSRPGLRARHYNL